MPAEAQVDHLRAGADRPADRARLRARRDRAVVADDLRDEQARRRSEARDPGPLSVSAAISPATKVPCPCVSFTLPPTKLLAATMPPLSSAMALVDAGVDHRHAHGQQLRQDVERVEGVEGAVLLDVPLALRQRVVRAEAGVRGSRRREGDCRRDAVPQHVSRGHHRQHLGEPDREALAGDHTRTIRPRRQFHIPGEGAIAFRPSCGATVANEPPASRCSWTAAFGRSRSRRVR